MKKNQTIGQIIKRIHSNEVSPSYCLFGNDSFLQDFIINELERFYVGNNGTKRYISIGDDRQDDFLKDLSSFSLFNQRELIIVRQVKRLSANARTELVNYLKNPNSVKCLVLISEDYDDRNSFQKLMKKNSLCIDVRVPFPSKVHEWVSYISKSRGYNIKSGTISNLVELYGDSIAHVVNEIEKIVLMIGLESEINDDIINKHISSNRQYNLWELQETIGGKNIKKSIKILYSLIDNGVSVPQVVVNLTNLFQELLWKSMGQYQSVGYTGLNKIILKNTNKYLNNYTKSEIEHALLELKKIDMLSKTTSIKPISLLEPTVIKICEGIYV